MSKWASFCVDFLMLRFETGIWIHFVIWGRSLTLEVRVMRGILRKWSRRLRWGIIMWCPWWRWGCNNWRKGWIPRLFTRILMRFISFWIGFTCLGSGFVCLLVSLLFSISYFAGLYCNWFCCSCWSWVWISCVHFKFGWNSGQHVELHNPNPPPHCIGYIDTKMSPVQVARNASEVARCVCLREYGSAPDVNIYGDPSFTFP